MLTVCKSAHVEEMFRTMNYEYKKRNHTIRYTKQTFGARGGCKFLRFRAHVENNGPFEPRPSEMQPFANHTVFYSNEAVELDGAMPGRTSNNQNKTINEWEQSI
jgi:hypothetical protein